MFRQKWLLPAVIVLTLILSLSLAFYFFYYRDRSVALVTSHDKTVGDSVTLSQNSMKRIAVFFVTSDGNALTTTEREIPGEVTLIEQLKMTIQILTSKPPEGLITPLPEGTRLLSLFTDSLGNAYLDFSREIQQNHIRGLTAELLTVSSIVNTLLFNFKDLKGVQLLVEGSEIETLAGHIDCTKPFSQLLVIENRT